METTAELRERLQAQFPEASISVITNPGPAAQHSLLIDAANAVSIAQSLRDDPALKLDQCTNVTGIDWPDGKLPEWAKVPQPVPADAMAEAADTNAGRTGCFEVVYHLYSVALRHGPVVIRLRTRDRSDPAVLPSLTSIWRSCEFQEREVYDLFGVVFAGHPDLRRILMWDEFEDHPMRKDYVAPEDHEWEPTPHGDVLASAQRHYPANVEGSKP